MGEAMDIFHQYIMGSAQMLVGFHYYAKLLQKRAAVSVWDWEYFGDTLRRRRQNCRVWRIYTDAYGKRVVPVR